MKKVRFYASEEKPEAKEVQEKLEEVAKGMGLRLVGPNDDRCNVAMDVVVSLGGDGTFMHAVHSFPDIPVIGFNLGGLGYLANVAPGCFEEALDAIARGKYSVSERSMLRVDGRCDALNDVVLVRQMTGRVALLEVKADGRVVTDYMADGLVFATPTGSTAYSLAAGGPVLMPGSSTVVVTPLNPHALSVRPLVVSDSTEFEVTVKDRTKGNGNMVRVDVDGQCMAVKKEGDIVRITKSPRTAKAVVLDGYDPYDVLAGKLGWSGSSLR